MNSFSIMNHVTNWLMRPRLGDDKPPSFWPSNASATDKNGNVYGMCRRQQFFGYLRLVVKYSSKSDHKYDFWIPTVEEIEKDLVPTSKYFYWIWEQGKLFEDHMLDLAKESGIFIGTQIQVYIPKENVSGKIDLIAYNPLNDKNIIVEAKSVYGPGGEHVLGTTFERKNGIMGEPKSNNLMQIALYDFHYADETFDNSQLVYGDRGSGKYLVYEVDVNKETGIIRYRCIDPYISEWVIVQYTIFDILNTYTWQQENVDKNRIPDRDFALKYSEKRLWELVDESYFIVECDKEGEETDIKFKTIQEFLDAGKDKKSRKFVVKQKDKFSISKDVAEKFVKYIDRKTNGGRQVKMPDSGDWNCRFCQFQNYCYKADGSPRK